MYNGLPGSTTVTCAVYNICIMLKVGSNVVNVLVILVTSLSKAHESFAPGIGFNEVIIKSCNACTLPNKCVKTELLPLHNVHKNINLCKSKLDICHSKS